MERNSTFISSHMYYYLHDMAMAQPILAEIIEKANSEPGCIFFGWQKYGEHLFSRAAFVDGDALVTHYSNVSFLLEHLENAASKESASIMGTIYDLGKIMSFAEVLGAKCFELSTPGFSRMRAPSNEYYADQVFCSIHSSFLVTDWCSVDSIVNDFISTTSSDENCLYHDWFRCGDLLCCREAYKDGDAMKVHFASVQPLVERMLGTGAMSKSLQFMGPLYEVAKIKEETKPLGAKYFHACNRNGGFQKF